MSRFNYEEYDERMADEYDFYEDWLNRDPEEYNISLQDYDDMRCAEEYGSPDPYPIDDDDDSFELK